MARSGVHAVFACPRAQSPQSDTFVTQAPCTPFVILVMGGVGYGRAREVSIICLCIQFFVLCVMICFRISPYQVATDGLGPTKTTSITSSILPNCTQPHVACRLWRHAQLRPTNGRVGGCISNNAPRHTLIETHSHTPSHTPLTFRLCPSTSFECLASLEQSLQFDDFKGSKKPLRILKSALSSKGSKGN